MTTTTATRAVAGAHTLARTLFARRGAVYLPTPTDTGTGIGTRTGTGSRTGTAMETSAGVSALEFDLVERGYLVGRDLREALTRLPAADLVGVGTWLLADIDAALGSDRAHVPLFRSFPDSTPQDTGAFYVDRVLTLLFQYPDQPCVLCGVSGRVQAVSPCAHLVCRDCFDGSDLSACPICHRRVDLDDPFLAPAPARPQRANVPVPQRLRVLGLGGDHAQSLVDAGIELGTLLARTGALSAHDVADLTTLLDTRHHRDLDWLPDAVPGRETKARVLAWLLADPATLDVTLPVIRRLVDTATDVLRLLAVRAGADAGLTEAPRFTGLSRPLRRALLELLDGLAVGRLTEDLRRHRRLWIRAAERLHPYEFATAYPRVATAFADLRGTRLRDDALAGALRATAAANPSFEFRASPDSPAGRDGERVRYRSFATQVETALAAGAVGTALTLLAARPGEFVRRLDHLLRLAAIAEHTAVAGHTAVADHNAVAEHTAVAGNTAAVLAALPDAARGAAPAVLLGALGELRGRHRHASRRVFFPRGGTAKAHLSEEGRPPLPQSTVEAVVAVLTGELLRRAATRGGVPVAVIDVGLAGLTAPFTERTAARALVTLPRGSRLPLPPGRILRLFLHWREPAGEVVDLDLSSAMFDASWTPVATCDYTNLRVNDTAAIHSGDLTSAPPPLGASEFLDLDPVLLRAAGVRYVVTAVFSFSGHPFAALDQAFAGVMVLADPRRGPVFDPAAVEQRFDLAGTSRALVPVVLDLHEETMYWLDMPQGVTGTHHSVLRHAAALGAQGEALLDLFGSDARVHLTELATWHAAARAGTVYVRATDGSAHRFARREDEQPPAFARRIAAALTPGAPTDHDGQSSPLTFEEEDPGLAYLVHADITLAADAEIYALYPGALDATAVRLLAAADLTTHLS